MAKNFEILIILSVVVLSFVGPASAETWSVDVHSGSDSTEIQAVINNASAGDTILVYSGVYRENVIVNKPVTLKGIGNPVVDASGSGVVITLCADGITVEGFNVTNSGSSRGDAGIKVTSCNNIIVNNSVSNNAHGIHIYKSRNNSITGNNVRDNKCYGIALFSSSINAITDNDVCDNDYGIDLYFSSINTITDNDVCNNGYGIRLDESSNNNITGNTVISNNVDGFHLRYSSNNNIVANTVSNSHGDGFDLWYSSNNNTITGNTVSNNRYGICLDESSNNNITGNTVSNSVDGIDLDYSNDNTITGNTFVNGALFVSNSYKNIVDNNVVNDKPLVYLEDASDIKVTDAGQVILVNCNAITVENLDLSDTNVGIELWKTENSRISGSKVSNNRYGICLWYSSNNDITDNTVSNNDDGIRFDKSSNNSISGNIVSNNSDGIYLDKSCNNSISDNDVSENDDGIRLSNSCFNNNIVGNTFVNDGLFVLDSYQNTVEGNIVNGKPLVYLENISDIEVTDAGQVILVNCDNITVENLDLYNICVGIELMETENSRLLNNKVSNNKRGICLYYSSSNSITGNNVSNNNWHGISIDKSSNNTIAGNNVSSNKRGICLIESSSNRIYLNNFINNGDPVHSFDSANIWNSVEEITYSYNGTTHECYLGNYWDDYEEKYPDAAVIGSTGIWDSSYPIDMDNDIYPLTMRFENYGNSN